MAVSLHYLCSCYFKGTNDTPFPLGASVLGLQNYFISSGKLLLLSNEARDMKREEMRKAGSNYREKRFTASLPRAPELQPLAPASH